MLKNSPITLKKKHFRYLGHSVSNVLKFRNVSTWISPNLLKFVKMLYTIINQETENFSSISIVAYFIKYDLSFLLTITLRLHVVEKFACLSNL